MVQWKGYEPEHDAWRNLPELGDATDLVKEYENAKRTTLPGKFQPKATLPETREDRARKLRKPSATSSAIASTEKPVVTTDLVPHGQKFAVVIPPRPVPTARKPF